MSYLSKNQTVEVYRAILQGDEAADIAFETHRISDFDQILLRRQAGLALRQIANNHHPIRRFFSATIKNPMQRNFLLAAIVTAFSVCALVVTIQHIEWGKPDTYTLAGAAAGFLAVAAATAGWTVSSWVAFRNMRVQQTITFVAHRFTHDTFNQKLATINEHLQGKTINSELIDELATSGCDKDREALQAVRYILNYFEFLSVCILTGNFDEDIVRKTMRGNFLFIYNRCIKYITELQTKNPKTLEHFTTMRHHFQEC